MVQAGCAEVCEDEGTAVDLERASVGQEEGHITTMYLDYQHQLERLKKENDILKIANEELKSKLKAHIMLNEVTFIRRYFTILVLVHGICL